MTSTPKHLKPFTLTHSVHKVDHTGKGVRLSDHGCFEAAEVAAEIVLANTKPSVLIPHPTVYVASEQENGTFKITYVS